MNGETRTRSREFKSERYYESPEEIEREIDTTRADLNDTLQALEQRLSPGQFVDQAISYWNAGPREFAQNLYLDIKHNPLPFSLLALGIGWMVRNERTRGLPRKRREVAYPSPETHEPKFVKVVEGTSGLS